MILPTDASRFKSALKTNLFEIYHNFCEEKTVGNPKLTNAIHTGLVWEFRPYLGFFERRNLKQILNTYSSIIFIVLDKIGDFASA